MDEEAKRVYMLLPEAIEIETAYMSCTQAAESCNGVIGELKTPIYPKAEQIIAGINRLKAKTTIPSEPPNGNANTARTGHKGERAPMRIL